MKTIAKLCLIAVAWSGAVWAQATAGSGAITGTIRDTYGDGIPDTDVIVINDDLGLERDFATTDDGVFYVPAIVPAPGYKLKISRKGYVDRESDFFSVRVGQTLTFNLILQAESATKKGAGFSPSLLDNNKTGVSSQVTVQQVDKLPLNPRRLNSVAELGMAVDTDSNSNVMTFLGQSFSNAVLTEGILTSNGYFTRSPVSVDHSTNQFSLDGMQELQVMNGDAAIEFGRAMNGIVNAVTRPSSFDFHGAGYEYLRLPSLTAVGRDSLGQKLLHGQNQTGANLGGPIPKMGDKLFFYANFEVLNGHFDGLKRITNQLIADPTGAIVAPANCKATAAQCTAVTKFIQSQMNVVVPLSQRWINGLAKIDYHLNAVNNFTFEYGLMNSLSPNGDQVANALNNGGLLGIRNTRDDSRFGKAGYVASLSPTFANEMRFGLSEEHIFQPASSTTLSTGDLGILLDGTTIGDSNINSNRVSEHRYELVDNLTGTFGKHTAQIGVDLDRVDYFINGLNSAGAYTYATLTNFATDLSVAGRNYTQFTQSFGNPYRRLPAKDIDVYGQDTWKWTRKLTITFGLRWEKTIVPQPIDQNNAYYQTGTIASPNLDIIPRLGVAYMLNRKTAIRAGYGYFYAPFTGEFFDSMFLGNAIYQTNIAVNPTQTNSPLFPKLVPSAGAIPVGTPEVLYSSSNLRNPHAQRASVGIERQLTSTTTISASFIDNRGYKLWTATDVNLAATTKSGTFTVDDAAGNKVSTFTIPIYTAKNDNNYAHVYDVENGGSSWYTAMAVEVRKRLSHGLSAQASYTWSHAIDDVGGPQISGGVPLITYDPTYSSNKANTATDRRQRLVINATYEPIFSQSDSWAARYLMNGWQISSIATLGSSQPETATMVASGVQISGITPAFPTTIDGSGAQVRVPFLPLDSLKTGPMYNWNARFTRTLPFTERVKGILMFEVFNLLNKQWISGVNTLAYTAATGILHPVPGFGAPNASASYPYGTNARSAQVAFRVTF